MFGPELDRKAKKASLIGIVGNSCLAVFKLAAGLFSGSLAVIADSLNSLSDLPGSLLVWYGLRKARKPPDTKHPFGHGDVEALIGLFVAISLVIVAYELGKQSVFRLIQQRYGTVGWLAILASGVSTVVKIALALYTSKLGEEVHSPALQAQAWDHKSDALSSAAVMFGVTGAHLGVGVLDPLLAFLVALVIGWMGIRVGKSNIENLIGTVPDLEMVERIEEIASGVKEVREVHKIRVHYFGPYAEVDMHAIMDPFLTIERSHAVTDHMIERIRNEIPEIRYATIHVEPR